ncbi:organic hydroperoxide resistance protein [Chitinimonas viridis]|uniref:Organic hydroperoxide resistance protein n=2 Tax=Chitinimonas TaxID=240411 RepID=A0ABT8B798_9NEIS|nr:MULTISPECIES: organic hydroperoxide resistance protein [Chitinimonas]MBL8508793.1 organic hydroperoxide resistance protein [Chitinimonas sp.]MDN3578132.1 organic hydroperoxide resistance protein [Chitinimonas viridis]GLR12015.1 organic hydroperoxide resistance protein [Chitinimonas prasina]
MSVQVLYTAQATATGGREGQIESSDGVLQAKLALPREMGGPGGAATNPEQLFAAGYAACFEGAVRFVARQKGIKIEQASVTAQVGVGPRAAGGFGITAALTVSLPGLDRAVATELAEIAHRDICPYSHATRGNVDVQITVA